MIGFAMWVACAGGGSDGPASDEPALEPLPWFFETTERSDDIDLVAVGEALDQAVREVLTYDARHVVDAYLDQLDASTDPNCPEVTVDGAGNRYWLAGCAADDGSIYSGFLFHYPQSEVPNGDVLFSGDTLDGNARIIDGLGRAIDIQGSVGFLTGTAVDGSSDLVVSSIAGGFGLDDAPEGWLATGPQSVQVVLVGLTLRSVVGSLVQVAGSVVTLREAGDRSDGAYAVTFDDNVMATGALSACNSEPGGTISVRDAEGRWLDITFDGPVLDQSAGDPTACDGCGRAVLDGVEIGEVCADFFPWLSWEALP